VKLLWFLAFSPLLVGQIGGRASEPPVSPTAKPEDMCNIEGNVVNSITGEPLKKVQITLEGRLAYGALTGGGGHFAIENINPGWYELKVSRNGFVTQFYSPRGGAQSTRLTLEKAQKLSDLKFLLVPQGVIAGRIRDEDGDVLAGAQVQCLKFDYSGGTKRLKAVQTVVTNDLGEYRFFGLAPGKYYVSADYRITRQPQNYLPVFYPRGTNSDAAAPIAVGAGATLGGIDLTLSPTRTVHVRGRVVGRFSNKGCPNCEVMLRSTRENHGQSTAAMGDQAAFDFTGVLPGLYLLMVVTNTEGRADIGKVALEVGDADMEGIVLSAAPTVTVTGRLMVEGSNKQPHGISGVSLEPTSPMSWQFQAAVNENGTFQFEDVASGNYRVTVRGPAAGYFVKSVRFGDTEVTESGLDFSLGIPPGELLVVLSSAGAQATGTLLDVNEKPVPDGQVVLIPESSKRELSELYKVVLTDADGHFVMKDIKPGEYKLFAWAQVEDGAWRDAEFLKAYESKGESVSLTENGHNSVALILIPRD
jgi:protocatechuate 3,4-dioxygenase beta subunit